MTLTEKQLAALRTLEAHVPEFVWPSRTGDDRHVQHRSAESLVRLGLAEEEWRERHFVYVYRITPAGRDLLEELDRRPAREQAPRTPAVAGILPLEADSASGSWEAKP